VRVCAVSGCVCVCVRLSCVRVLATFFSSDYHVFTCTATVGQGSVRASYWARAQFAQAAAHTRHLAPHVAHRRFPRHSSLPAPLTFERHSALQGLSCANETLLRARLVTHSLPAPLVRHLALQGLSWRGNEALAGFSGPRIHQIHAPPRSP
jgi:hypothetical protein